MVKQPLITILLIFFLGSNIHAQKIYSSNQLKLIFSNAPNVSRNGTEIASPMRFSGFFNYSTFVNVDLTKRIGFSVGVEIKNIGLILKDSVFHTKHRAYALGLPVYFRIGNLEDRWYFFAGAQYDYLFGYKEKVFVNNSKTKRTGGYSQSVRPFIPSVFLGFRFKNGTSFGLNYMLENFLSANYRFKDPTNNNMPLNEGYKNTQLFYFSIGFIGDLDKRKTRTQPSTPTPPENREVYSRHR